MNAGSEQMGHTKHGQKDRDQQSLVHRHIAYPRSDGGPGIAGECSFVRREVVAVPAEPLDLARPHRLEQLSRLVVWQGNQAAHHLLPRRKLWFGRLRSLLMPSRLSHAASQE